MIILAKLEVKIWIHSRTFCKLPKDNLSLLSKSCQTQLVFPTCVEEKHKRSLCRREQIGLAVTWEEDSCFCFWRTSTDCEAFTVVLHCSWIRIQGPLKDFFCICWEVNRAYIDRWNTVPFFHCCSSVFSLVYSVFMQVKWSPAHRKKIDCMF